jgi:hypothetical protein
VARALAALLLAMALPALAHAPWSEPLGRLGELELHKSYVDGIVAIDPVRFEARGRDGKVLAHTEFGRDVALWCEAASCLVFQSGGAWSVLPDAWWLEGARLQPASAWLGIPGAALLFADHLVGYAVALAIGLVPALLVRRARGWLRRTLAALVGLFVLLVSLGAVAGYTRLSIPALLFLVALGTAAMNLTAIKEYLRRSGR